MSASAGVAATAWTQILGDSRGSLGGEVALRLVRRVSTKFALGLQTAGSAHLLAQGTVFAHELALVIERNSGADARYRIGLGWMWLSDHGQGLVIEGVAEQDISSHVGVYLRLGQSIVSSEAGQIVHRAGLGLAIRLR